MFEHGYVIGDGEVCRKIGTDDFFEDLLREVILDAVPLKDAEIDGYPRQSDPKDAVALKSRDALAQKESYVRRAHAAATYGIAAGRSAMAL